MTETPSIHFEKAPIVEAVIGIDFGEPLPLDAMESLREVGAALEEDYPTVENMTLAEYKIQPGSPVAQTETAMGFFLKNAEGIKVVHAKRTGFAFSWLSPYDTWGAFVSEANRTWSTYRKFVGGAGVSKYTIRYINRLSWPNGAQIEDYLAVYPHIPEGLPQSLGACFLRLDYPLSEPHQGQLIQQVASVPQADPRLATFVLDNEFSFSAIGLNDSEIWIRINSCQEIKNRAFLSSITLRMRELIS